MRRIVELPYLHQSVIESDTLHGYLHVEGLDGYKDVYIRNRVIIRIDVFSGMTDIFSEDIIREIRTVVFNTMAGVTRDKEMISKVLTALYLEDKTFRKFIGELYYFNEDRTISFYEHITSSVRTKYTRRVDEICDLLQGTGAKVIVESDGYLYISYKDSPESYLVPSGYKREGVSRAKIWKGDFSEK